MSLLAALIGTDHALELEAAASELKSAYGDLKREIAAEKRTRLELKHRDALAARLYEIRAAWLSSEFEQTDAGDLLRSLRRSFQEGRGKDYAAADAVLDILAPVPPAKAET